MGSYSEFTVCCSESSLFLSSELKALHVPACCIASREDNRERRKGRAMGWNIEQLWLFEILCTAQP